MSYRSIEWMADGECFEAGRPTSELFFPERGASTRPATEMCNECSVKDECLSYALETGQNHGIWGGLTARQRRLLLARKAKLKR